LIPQAAAERASDEPHSGLADLGDWLTGGVVFDGDNVDAAVILATPDQGDMNHR
jgi:hypothetical protein